MPFKFMVCGNEADPAPHLICELSCLHGCIRVLDLAILAIAPAIIHAVGNLERCSLAAVARMKNECIPSR